jgi:hypothetical protein
MHPNAIALTYLHTFDRVHRHQESKRTPTYCCVSQRTKCALDCETLCLVQSITTGVSTNFIWSEKVRSMQACCGSGREEVARGKLVHTVHRIHHLSHTVCSRKPKSWHLVRQKRVSPRMTDDFGVESRATAYEDCK